MESQHHVPPSGEVPHAAEPPVSLRPKVYRAVAWSGLGSLMTQVVTFSAALALTRLLSPSIFGTMAIALAVTGVAITLADTGLMQALVQKQEIAPADINSAFWVQALVSCGISGILIACAGPLADLFRRETVQPLIVALACAIPLQAVALTPRALLIRDLRTRETAQIDICASLLGAVVGVAGALKGYGVWSLVAATLATTSVAGVGAFVLARWRPTGGWDRAALRPLISFARPLYGYTLINYMVRNGDNMIIGRFLGPFELGLYARAYSLLLLPTRQITQVIGGPLQVSLARMAGDLARSKRVYLEACGVIAFVSMPLMLFVAVLADDFVPVVMGDQWTASVPAVRLLAVVGIIEPLATTCGWIYFAQGRTDLSLRVAMLLGPVLLIGIGIGVAFGSATSAALAYLIVNVLGIPVLLATAGRLIGVSLADYFFCIRLPLLAAVGSGLMVFLTRQVSMTLGLGDFVRLLLCGVVGVGVYLLLGRALKLPEIATVERRLRRSRHLAS